MTKEQINKSSNKNIFLGSLIGYITIAVNVVFGFVSIPLIIQKVGDSGYGLFTLATSIINVFVIDFGLGTAANNHLSKALANNDEEHFKDTTALIFRIFLYMDIIFGVTILILLLFANKIFTGLTPEEIVSFRGVFLIIGIYSLIALPSTIFNSILSANEKFFFIKVVNLFTRFFYIGVVLTVLFLGGGLYGLVFSHVVCELLCIIVKYIFVRFKLKTKIFIRRKISKEEKKLILGFSIWACLQSIFNRLSYNFSSFIMGITTNSTEIAIFGVISTFENYISMIASVMSGFFLPKINRIKNSKDPKKEFEELSYKIGKIQAAVVFIIMIGFLTCGKEFITLWISSTTSYSDVYLGTLLTALPNIVFCPQLIFYTAMFTEKKTMKHLAISSFFKTIVFLSLVFPLSKKYGAIGVSFSIMISKSIEIILENIFYKHDLKISLSKYFIKTYACFILPIAISLSCGLLIHFSNDRTLFKLIKIVFLVPTTFLLTFIVSLSDEEKEEYKQAIKSLIKH